MRSFSCAKPAAARPSCRSISRSLYWNCSLTYVELQEVATQQQIQTLAKYTECPPEKMQAVGAHRCRRNRHSQSNGGAAKAHYTRAEVLAKRKSLLDLLEEFPACALALQPLLGDVADPTPALLLDLLIAAARPATLYYHRGRGQCTGPLRDMVNIRASAPTILAQQSVGGTVKSMPLYAISQSAFRLPEGSANSADHGRARYRIGPLPWLFAGTRHPQATGSGGWPQSAFLWLSPRGTGFYLCKMS